MTKIIVNRHQYGVGQGGFHFQKISLSGKDSGKRSFCFVYDCGGEDTLHWCIQHVKKSAKKFILDAVYISHFEQDHVNGLTELCSTADVKRIFVPYIDEKIAIHLIAKQVSSGVAITPNYISDLSAVARGEPIHGVPVTRITPGGLEAPPLPNQGNFNNSDIEIDEIEKDIPTEGKINNNKSIKLKISQNLPFWELVHWCYAPYDNLSTKLLEELRGQFPNFDNDIYPAFSNNTPAIEANKIAEWIEINRGKIKKCYDLAIRKINKTYGRYRKIPDDHNVVSLCLYSGPIPRKCQLQNYDSFPKNLQYYCCVPCYRYGGAWLGTGDAMLKRIDVWRKFKGFFDDRLDACSTVVIPHHGANSQQSNNYQSELIRPLRNCVISAGATYKFYHPHISVVQDILSHNGILHLVSENNPLGFVEHLEFEI